MFSTHQNQVKKYFVNSRHICTNYQCNKKDCFFNLTLFWLAYYSFCNLRRGVKLIGSVFLKGFAVSTKPNQYGCETDVRAQSKGSWAGIDMFVYLEHTKHVKYLFI